MFQIHNLLGFGLGTQELLIIVVLVLLLFGGTKIPQLMKGLGKGVGEFQKGLDEGKRNFENAVDSGKSEPVEKSESSEANA